MYVRLSPRKAPTNKVKLAIRADNEVILAVEYSLMKFLFGRSEASDCPYGNLEEEPWSFLLNELTAVWWAGTLD